MNKYKEKLLMAENKEDTVEINKELALLEDRLDVTSIVIGREKVKVKVRTMFLNTNEWIGIGFHDFLLDIVRITMVTDLFLGCLIFLWITI